MKRFSLLLIFSLLCISCLLAQSSDWIDVEDQDMEFKVSFYNYPEVIRDTLDAPSNTHSVTYGLRVREQDHPNGYYALAIIEFPKNEIHSDSVHITDEILDATQSSLVNDEDFELVSVQYKANKGYPGKEYRWMLKDNSSLVRHQVFLVKNRLYMLTVTSQAEENYNAYVNAFFDSFELIGIPYNPHAEEKPVAEERFTIEFPGQVEERVQKLESPYGTLTFFLKLYQPQQGDNLVYLAGYTDYPDEAMDSGDFDDLDKFYKTAIEGSLTATQGELLEQKSFKYKRHKGKEYIISLQNGEAIATYRCLLIGNTLFTYGVMTARENQGNDKLLGFIDSFESKKKKRSLWPWKKRKRN